MLRKSYYLTLGVSPNETTRGIRAAYLQLVKRYHPDRLGSERGHYFQRILEAYHVLADPVRRNQYNQGLDYSNDRVHYSTLATSLGFDGVGHIPQAAAILRSQYVQDAVFEAALARVSGRLTAAEFSTKETPEPLTARVILSGAEAARGGVVFLGLPTGFPCQSCGGSGRDGIFACSRCDGEGLVEERETVQIQIPPMASDGTIMEVPLRGLGVHNFYLRVNIRVVERSDPRALG